MYARGAGVSEDESEAVRWYRLAAQQGLAEAQFSLGNMYFNGRGVPQDYEEAARWVRLAAAQGNALAQITLASMLRDGAWCASRRSAGGTLVSSRRRSG